MSWVSLPHPPSQLRSSSAAADTVYRDRVIDDVCREKGRESACVCIYQLRRHIFEYTKLIGVGFSKWVQNWFPHLEFPMFLQNNITRSLS